MSDGVSRLSRPVSVLGWSTNDPLFGKPANVMCAIAELSDHCGALEFCCDLPDFLGLYPRSFFTSRALDADSGSACLGLRT